MFNEISNFFKKLNLFILPLLVVGYAIMWYNDVKVNAWEAMIWVFLVFINDLRDYLVEYNNKLRAQIDENKRNPSERTD